MHVGTRPVLESWALSRVDEPRAGVEGRMPAAWLLVLIACLAASTGLPPGLPWLVALVLVIGLGVPHGALDGEVARPLLQPRFGRAWFTVFAVPYLALSACVIGAWHLAPVPTLAAFLAVSVFHFGEEDTGTGFSIELLFRGGLPVALPVLLHPAGTASVLGTVALVPMVDLPAWLVDASFGWMALAAVALAQLAIRRRWAVLAEVAGLFAVFAVLPPLTAFAAYFIGFHAPRHMAGLIADPVRAPSITTMRAAVLHALPVTGLTILLGAVLWCFYPGPAPERLLSVTLQGLAALTLPHLLLSHLPMPAAAGAARATDGRRPRTVY